MYAADGGCQGRFQLPDTKSFSEVGRMSGLVCKLSARITLLVTKKKSYGLMHQQHSLQYVTQRNCGSNVGLMVRHGSGLATIALSMSR